MDHDPLTGVSTWYEYDSSTGGFTIAEEQDAAPFLERNKRFLADEDYGRQGIKNDWWHVASIPIGLQYKWLREDGINVFDKSHWPKVRRKLMDPEYGLLRTAKGRI